MTRFFAALKSGALREFLLYPLSPNGGESKGKGEYNFFFASLNKAG